MARADSDTHGSILLLIDFVKAYDTLQRPYLLSALTWGGFSCQLVSVVAALHRSTTCRFVVNGYRSRRREVSCKISQGCPLAPLLLILALDSVYWVIQRDRAFVGCLLHLASETLKLKGRYTLMIRPSTCAIGLLFCRVVTILDDFASVSGLVTNRAKSMIVGVDPRGSALPLITCGLTLLTSSEFC